ncbi:MAG TPA: cyclase family protein, partial [Acidimicrobiia bacterium]
MLPPEVKELAAQVRNWGRWGADDEIGTLNLITDDVVRAAAGEIRVGRRLALGLPLNDQGPQTGVIPGRDNPTHEMIMVDTPLTGDPSNFTTSDDKVILALQAATHWDALAHVSYEGQLYNGVPSSVITDAGAARMGIDKIRTLVGRGVLLDVAAAKGADRLEGGYPLTAADLDAACAHGQVEVRSGDIVLLRTGQMQWFLEGDREKYGAPAPGPSLQTVAWSHDNDVAAVATDNLTFEVFPSERED